MREKAEKKYSMKWWKRCLAGLLSMVMIFTSVDLTALAYQSEKSGYLTAVDKDGNEIVKEEESWEEEFPNGTFAFKNEYINLQESSEPETQKITIYRLGGTEGEAVAKIAVSPVISYLDEEGTEAVYANAASSQDYVLEAEDPIGTSENGEITYTPVEWNREDIYGTSFFDITFAEGEWVKDVLVTPIDDEEHESQELALLTIYEAEGAEFTETANRATISIADDEEVLPSEMGFDAEPVRVDKADQKAVIKVKRTGALQYVSSVEYRTEDGTAKAGKDYVKSEGTASFSGDIDYFEIQVDLIDNKQKSKEDKSFAILLSDPKGGTVKESGESIQVDLYNSNTSREDNLATRLWSPDAADLTGQVKTEEKALTENDNQVVTAPETETEEAIEAEYTPANEKSKLLRSVVTEGKELHFGSNMGLWKGIQTNPKDVGTWKSEQYSPTFDRGAKITSNYNDYMALNIPGIYNRFTDIDWNVKCETSIKFDGLPLGYYLSATYGALGTSALCYSYTGNMGDTGVAAMNRQLNNELYKNDVSGNAWLFKYRGGEAGTTSGRINITSAKYDHLVFKILGTRYRDTQRARPASLELFDFAIHRRALSRNPVVTIITPDDDDNLLSAFQDIKPIVEISGQGGTNGKGKLYYGSKLKVTENAKANQYKMAKAVLTTQSGSTLWNGNINPNDNYAYLEIAKQGNIKDRLTEDNLQIKTYLERVQKFDISYEASMLEDDTEEVKKQKKEKISSNITYKLREFNTNTCTYQDYGAKPNLTDRPNDSRYQTEDLKNVKSVNFNLNDGSLILYNNMAYAGNADIPISPDHYNSAIITFSVYTPDAISVERDPKILSINKIRLYVDENDDGAYTDGETLLKDIPGQELCIDEFQPVDGHSLVLKVDYTYMPACISAPPGGDENETFSLTPSFVTTLTEESVKEKLTEEMQGYRDILCKDGSAKLYADSNGTLSVPLGQDASPAQFDEDAKAYKWTPKWEGNLAKDYADPEKIYLDNTLMPNNFEAASTKEEINQYLGCLQGNDTLVISSRMGTKATAIQAAGFSSYPEMGVQSFDQAAMPGVNAPQDNQGVTSNLPDMADSNPSMKLPSMEIGIGPLSYIMGNDEIGFSVGIPLIEEDLGASKEENQKSLEQAKESFNSLNVFQKLRERANKYGPDSPGFEGGDMRGKSNAASFAMAANATFMWKYSKKTANYEFSSAMVAVAVSGSVKLQYRFSACPIFYVYLSMGGEMNMKTGLNVKVDLDENGNKKNDVSFAGLTIEPSVFIEAGAGVGIDIAKLEVYVHVSVSMAMTLNDDFSFDKFETGAAVGFNAVFLFFSFKMDLVGCTAGYDKEEEGNGSNGWYFKWSLCGKEMRSRMASAAQVPEIAGANVTVEPPKDTSSTQKFYTSDDNVAPEIMPMAFDLEGMPFQTGGYGSSVAAVKLADGLNAAAGYELLTVGDKNYLVYTISRERSETGRDADSTQIVLSELTTASSKGDEVKGLANPLDPDSEKPYIAVDQKDGKEDGLGDLEFGTSVKDGKIIVTWTSYEEDAYDNVDPLWDDEEILAEISRHVCVKTASFTPEAGTGFTDAQVVSEEKDNAGYRFLPKTVNDQVLFFGEAEPYSQKELKKKKEEYKAYYETAADGNETDGSGGTGDPYANANYKYSITLDSLYGQYSRLNFAVKQKDGQSYGNVSIEPSDSWKDQGARIDYIRFMEDTEDSFFLAYATSQEEVKDGDKQTVKKLYLQKVSVKEDAELEGTTLVPGQPALIKTLVDSEQDDNLDGEYQNSQLVEPFAAPAFNNLKFLKGKLAAGHEKETFFLFGMNGMTYVIDENNLNLICVGEGGTITPFFKAEENGNSQADTVIGADGDGNISAVYTDTVPNTVNNALYLTKYDPSIGAFGEGIMLAMNHMQVYEDAQAGSWSAEETREAYFDESKSGGMNKFSFAQPQIALGTPTTEDTQGTLTIISQGTYTDLVKTTLRKPGTEELVEEVIPDMQNGVSGQMGVYALTYGVGKQQIGEEAIQLNMEEFVPGAKLEASVSFRNTGDVAIRASDDDRYAASVKLYAAKKDGSDARELASWKILSNVLAGQQVATDMVQTKELPEDIADRVLYFEVSENADYITDGAFLTSTFNNDDGLGKIVVGNRAEVCISDISVSAGQDMRRENVNGEDSVIVDLDMTLENKGVKNAENIRIQLERTDGKTESGENNYIPLDLGQTLVRHEGQSGSQDLTESGKGGIYKVTGGVETVQEGEETVKAVEAIPAGESVRLKGKITLPAACFDLTSPKEAMNLRFTVLTDTKEYTEQNNASYVSFDPVTKFNVPSALNLTLGNTVNFDMTYVTGAAKNSNISATEMVLSSAGEAQEASADGKLLDVLNYNPVNGMLSVRAGKTGSGIVRIADTTSNSYVDMVFTNTAEGTNIALGNKALVFKNSPQGEWEDKEIGKITAEAVLPYNHDICVGKKGGSFTFTTYASGIELYFSGKAEVSSKNAFGFGSVIVEGNGKNTGEEYFEPVIIDFKNTELKKHEVTVTVLGDQAEFDKMVEKYGKEGDVGDIAEKDMIAPKIFLGKQMPGEGKLQMGTVFEMPVYIYDNMAINSVSIDGGGADTYVHQGFAKSVLSITENRTYRIIAVDSYGNRASYDIVANWFDTGAAAESEKDTWPEVSAEPVNELGESIQEFTNGAAYIRYRASASQGIVRIKVYGFNPDDNSAVQLGGEIRPSGAPKELNDVLNAPIPKNGYYKVEVEDTLRQITSKIFYLNCLSNGPEVNLYKSSNQAGKLFYSVGSQTNEVNLEQMVIYQGKVQQTSPDSIEVTGKTPVLARDYSQEAVTWDTGTMDLSGTTVYTIMAKDVSGRIRTFVYSDNSSLAGLAVHAEGYDLEMEAFSPYQHEYRVLLPYGYPENLIPSVEYSISEDAAAAGAVVKQRAEEDSVTVTMSYDGVDTDYTIYFEREVCTCGIELVAYDNQIIIPYGQDTLAEKLDTRIRVLPCSIKGHEYGEEDVEYSFEVLEGQNYVDIANDGTATYQNFPKGSVGVTAKVKITAYTDIVSAEAVATCSINKKYGLHLETTHCGHIEMEEEQEPAEDPTVDSEKTSRIILPTEDGSKTVQFELTSGEDYQFIAVADKGCIFEGWADETGEIRKTENEITGITTGNIYLKAVFKDVTPPVAAIDLKALEKPEEGEGKDEILYSREGIEITVTGEDYESGVRSIRYQIVEAGETYDEESGWKDYAEPVTLTDDIFAVVYAKVEDKEGNVTIVHSKEILIDKEGGKLILTPNFTSGEWTRKEDAQIHVLATEGTSPLRRITYIVDGKAYLRKNNQFVIGDLEDGDYEVKVIAEDEAGHTLTETIHVRKETVETTIDVTGNPTELVREATLTANVNTGVSGLKEITVNGRKIEGNTYKLSESENGTYVFAATSNGGSTAAVTVEVTNMIIKVEGIEATGTEVSLATGKTHQINWKVLPEDATYQQVTFTSDDEDKVTVDENGLITALKEGEAAITITSVDNPSIHTEIAMDLFEEYKFHASVDTGGKVEYEGKILLTSEEGGQTEADVYLRKGTEYTLKAIPLEGYEFTGWRNGQGELVQKEAVISSRLMQDVALHADFRDNVAPEGIIHLKELDNPDQVEMLAKLAEEPENFCVYSSRGFQVTIESSDMPSGVKSVEYQVLDAEEALDETKGWQQYKEPFTMEEDCHVIVYARIEDRDGNVTHIHSEEIVIDHKGVSIQVQPNFTPGEWNNSGENQIKVKVMENVTQIKKINWLIGEETYETKEQTFVIDELKDGDYEIRIVTEDAAGNLAEAVIPLKQDTSVPTLKVTGNPTQLERSATLEIQAQPGISGLKEIRVNGTVIEGTSYTTKENGTCEISVTNQAGTTATETIEVTKVIVEVAAIQADTEHAMVLGDVWRINWKVEPSNADFPQVTFASSDQKTVSVSDTGLVTAKKGGKAVLTISSVDHPGVKKEVTIQVQLPKIKVKAQSDQQVMLTWKGVAGAKEYLIFRSTKNNGKYKRIGRARESAYRDKNAKKGKTYYYKVQAIGAEARYNGGLGDAVKAKACLKTPDNVKVTISGKNYKIRWGKSDGAKSYTVYRSANEKGGYKRIGSTVKNSFTDQQSGRKKKWYYKVKAVGSKSKYNSGDSKSIAYQKKVLLKKASVSLQANPNVIAVSWEKVAGATNYQIYRAESQRGIYSKIAETGKAASFRDETVEKGKWYYYKVRAVSRIGKMVKKTGIISKAVKAKAK